MTGRKRKYDSAAARQKAYRDRQKAQPQTVTLQNCPGCGSNRLINYTGDIPMHLLIDPWAKEFYVCKQCCKAIARYGDGDWHVYTLMVRLSDRVLSELRQQQQAADLQAYLEQKESSQQ